MNKPARIVAASITVDVDVETLAVVETLAGERGISSAQFAAEAVRRVAECEADFRTFIRVGIDAVERGDVVPHEQVMAELDAMIDKHRVRCG